MTKPLKIAIVAGEESGDLLAADLVSAMARMSGRPVELVGVGGRHLEALGLRTLFDAGDIALMGVTAVLRRLPGLLRKISLTADAMLAAEPDLLVTVDSPEFGLRVAKRVKAKRPHIPTVHYVCPSVWAWRPERAARMKAYVDRILCLLPFEPAELERLGGPPGTFVGHRLNNDPMLQAAAQNQQGRALDAERKTLLVLPGSRRSEVSRLAQLFGDAVGHLDRRGHSFEVLLPTVPHVAGMVEQASAQWAVRPRIIHDTAAKYEAFGRADAALAASGTVLLELALAGVPTISCYKTDRVWRALMSLVTVWSAALPNLIAGWPVVPELYNEYARAEYIARLIEQLWSQTPAREAQLAGFAEVRQEMTTDRPSGEIAAETVLRLIG